MKLRDLILNNFAWKLLSLVLAMLVYWHVNKLLKTEAAQAPTSFSGSAKTETFSLPVRVLGPARNPRGFVVIPSEVTVTLRGRSDVLERIHATNIIVYVDAAFAPNTQSATLPVTVRPPPGATVQEVRPAGVYVEQM